MADLWLSDSEIDEICCPLTQPAAQVRFLRTEKKLYVETKKNGRPLVIRSHAAAVLAGLPAETASREAEKADIDAPQPNVEAFMRVIQGGKRNGSPKKVQSA